MGEINPLIFEGCRLAPWRLLARLSRNISDYDLARWHFIIMRLLFLYRTLGIRGKPVDTVAPESISALGSDPK